MRRVATGLLFLTIVLSIWSGMHYLVWRHVAEDTALPSSLQTALAVLLVLFAASTFITLLRVLPRPILAFVWSTAFTWAGFVFLLFFLFLIGDVVCLVLSRIAPAWSSLDLARGEAVAVIAVGAILALIARLTASRDAPIKRVEITLDKLPPALSGFSIVQISDLHVSPDTMPTRVQRLVERANALAPDLIALTGDLVDGAPDLLRQGIAPLTGLRSRYGSFFVTGNHEYFSGADRWIDTFKSMGFHVLQNERVTIGEGSNSFELAGIPDRTGSSFGANHRPRLADVLTGTTPGREIVLLAHQPRQFPEAAQLGVGLQLSGHTHGGQIWPFTWLIHLGERYVAGLHRIGPSQLYVSRGTGFWGPPMRLFAPMELTQIILRSQGA